MAKKNCSNCGREYEDTDEKTVSKQSKKVCLWCEQAFKQRQDQIARAKMYSLADEDEKS